MILISWGTVASRRRSSMRKSKPITIASIIAIIMALHGRLPAGENILENGVFEEWSGGLPSGWMPVWPSFLKEAPRFEREAEKPHGGEACAAIRLSDGGGYSSYMQRIEDPPEEAVTARLEGWIRAEKGTAASLILIFFDPDDPKAETLLQTPAAAATGEWTRVEVEAPVPASVKKWLVRCGIAGKGAAAFDDISLTWSKEKIEGAQVVLAEGHGKYFVVPGGSGPASISLSIPFPFGGQTPLALSVESDPPDAVLRLDVKAERDNRPLCVVLRPDSAKRKVLLRVNTLTLLRDRSLADGAGIPLAEAGKVPGEVKVHLRAARGVEAGDHGIREIAGSFSRKDAAALLGDLTKFLREKLKYEGGADQGARNSIRTGKAVCTGYANAAAALLIAAGVPARILACTQTEGKLQEHYIVEAWAPGPGWMRIETTMARFPWPDSRNLIVRIIYPEAQRSPANVPLYWELSGAKEGGFDGDPGDGCWQSADTHLRLLVEDRDIEAIEKAARKAFEACVSKPVAGGRVRFVPEAGKLPGLGERGRKLIEEVDRRAAPEAPGPEKAKKGK
jgi:hypothetical protein